jgi:hypothetical protein
VEIKDIRDELTMILKVLGDQHTVLTAMASELTRLDPKLVPQGADIASLYKLRHEVVNANIRDFKTMMAHADGTYEGVCAINWPSTVLRADINHRSIISWNSSKNKSTQWKPALHGSWRKRHPDKEM